MDAASLPADVHWVSYVLVNVWPGTGFEVTDIKVGKCVVEKAMHGAVRTVHVQVHEAWDEVRGE